MTLMTVQSFKFETLEFTFVNFLEPTSVVFVVSPLERHKAYEVHLVV